MEAKVTELTGYVDEAGPGAADTGTPVDRMFGIVEEKPKPRSAGAITPAPRNSCAPRAPSVGSRGPTPSRQGSVCPEPPRYPAVLLNRLFAAAGKAWKRVWNPKLMGEKAELLFMYEAARRGLIVSKPYGDSAPYDAIVENRKHPGKLWRVQVRSTSYQNKGWYMVRTDRGSQRQVLTPKDADILAVYITPEEVWYIIPVAAFRGKLAVYFSPHKKRRWRKPGYERFREAWGLIGADTKPATNTASPRA